jgi:hypothetical protein
MCVYAGLMKEEAHDGVAFTHLCTAVEKPRGMCWVRKMAAASHSIMKGSLHHGSLLATDGGLVKEVLLTLRQSLKTFTDLLHESL